MGNSFFPKNSAWDRGHHESDREFQERMTPPLRTPEDNQRIAASQPKTASVHESSLEEWATALEIIANEVSETSSALDLEDLAVQIRSHLRG